MPLTPDEYAAKELNVPGWDKDEPVYVPDSDPNIAEVMNGGPVTPEPEPAVDANLAAMQYEYNFELPLAIRRAELEHLNARTGFWNSLTALILSLVGNAP